MPMVRSQLVFVKQDEASPQTVAVIPGGESWPLMPPEGTTHVPTSIFTSVLDLRGLRVSATNRFFSEKSPHYEKVEFFVISNTKLHDQNRLYLITPKQPKWIKKLL